MPSTLQSLSQKASNGKGGKRGRGRPGRRFSILQWSILSCLSVLAIGCQWYTFFFPTGTISTIPRLATSHRQVLQNLERQTLLRGELDDNSSRKLNKEILQKLLAGIPQRNLNSTATSAEKEDQFPHRQRTHPNSKIVYLLHIHKSAGSALCRMARYNYWSTSRTNCNVQNDQRCCGKADTLQAQQDYYYKSPHDFVASEGRMYHAMDPKHYRYIVVLRKSQERYCSHWKHTRRTYSSLPNFLQDDSNDLPWTPAGGMRKQQRQQPLQAQLTTDQKQQEHYNHVMDLVRESKHDRKARREEKMRLMQEWQQHLQQELDNNPADSKGRRRPLVLPPPLETKQEDMAVSDFAMDASLNEHRFFPHRQRRRLLQRPTIAKDSTRGEKKRRQLVQDTSAANHDDAPARLGKGGEIPGGHRDRHFPPEVASVPGGLLPHPAEDPNLDWSRYQKPRVGKSFSSWWRAQPDNWNVRQLCGTRCIGVPKYQLTMQHWAYTLERFLLFDTVLFVEDLQTSVTILAARLGWNESSLQAIQDLDAVQEELQALEQEASRRRKQDGVQPASPESLRQWYQEQKAKEKNRHSVPDPIAKDQLEDWDPLMSALDDALYDIGRRWERLKWNTNKTTEQLKVEELLPLVDIAKLSNEAIQGAFQWYMEDAPGNHRTQCHNECCAIQCSAW